MSNNRNSTPRSTCFSTIPINEEEGLALRFLYHTIFGRMILWLLIRESLSKLIGHLFDSKISKWYIKKFISKNNIDMSRFEEKEYQSFNDFFTRKLKNIEEKKETKLASPCDGKLTIYPIDENQIINVKHSKYSISSLIQDENLAQKYQNGHCLIFRLTPDDYHRYHFIDDGQIIATKSIKGVLHTVRPIALKKYQVYTENSRVVTKMNTKHFGTITQIEVGALMVGKIKNHDIKTFKKGEEKGMFLFGGSTIILLIEKDKINISSEIIKNTENNLETLIHYQDSLEN